MSEAGEPHTPREEAQVKVELLARDLWSSARELVMLRADPDFREFFSGNVEADLWRGKTNLDVLISELRATQMEAA